MRAVLGFALAGLLGATADDKAEKIDGKKLVGKWESVGGPAVDKGITFVLEFTKDGKLSLDMQKGELKKGAKGTYKLDGNKLAMTLDKGGAEKTDEVTVTKLTDDELAIKDSKGEEDRLKRVKDKKDKK